MAINIFSGSNPKQSKNVNSASQSVRAQQAKSALAVPAEVSASGNTAVGSKSTLSKVGGFLGKAAKVAGKFLPGVGGVIANAAGDLLNDPEWWQSVPGDSVTLNEPLRIVPYGSPVNGVQLISQAGINPPTKMQLHSPRAAILEITSMVVQQHSNSDVLQPVMMVSENQATQYLMPQVRKVVNAVPLQSAQDYILALESAATIYAIWRDLRKIDYMNKHGQTYLPSMNDKGFPLFRTENAAWLQSTINRLEEYLRANVRIPHTLCEYLAWRYGRVYKSNASAKAALVVYSTVGLTATPDIWDLAISAMMKQVSGAPTVQKANSDLYNTYFSHDYMVEVRDDTQFRYDMKEFMLRLNSQYRSAQVNGENVPEITVVDSSLDNPTAFMASTVSAYGTYGGDQSCLFPVGAYNVYIPRSSAVQETAITPLGLAVVGTSENQACGFPSGLQPLQDNAATYDVVTPYDQGTMQANSSTLWLYRRVDVHRVYAPLTSNVLNPFALMDLLCDLMLCKSTDLYNVGIYVQFGTMIQSGGKATPPAWTAANGAALDLTALSIDAGTPTEQTIGTEHIYAFANLVDIARTHSMSYKQAEKLVAKDTAELIDKLDVASVGTKTP